MTVMLLWQQANAATANRVAPPSFKNCIQLAACSAEQVLPMNPDLPADIFTSCLTTPIKIALRWYVHYSTTFFYWQNKISQKMAHYFLTCIFSGPEFVEIGQASETR